MSKYDPYQLANDGLVSYSGDRNPLGWGGMWYDASTWIADGYASVVRVAFSDDEPIIYVERLIVNRPTKPESLERALQSIGWDGANASPDVEIEACLAYGHYAPDEGDYREPSQLGFAIGDDVAEMARIHGAMVATLDDVWAVLNTWVGRDLYCGRD
jgi:hypothetical protein